MSTMTRALAFVGAAALLAGAVSGCASHDPDTGSTPEPVLSATQHPDAEVPGGKDLAAWAEGVLPENGLGGEGAVARETGTLTDGPDEVVEIDVSQADGLWELALACESADGSPLSFELIQDGTPLPGLFEVPCFSPSGDAVPGAARIAYDGGHDTRLRLAASADAVYVYTLRPGTPAGT